MGRAEIRRFQKMKTAIKILAIYSMLICSYSIIGHFWVIGRVQTPTIWSAISSVLAFAPVIAMCILVIVYLRRSKKN